MIDKAPKKCNLCGGFVVFKSNIRHYGRKQGSGYMYYCTKCGAYVGTHKNSYRVAMGILANKEMRDMKMKCHTLFDKQWNTLPNSTLRYKARNNAYKELAKRMKIDVKDCHFGHFDLDQLNKAYDTLIEIRQEERNGTTRNA